MTDTTPPATEPLTITRRLQQASEGDQHAWREVYPWIVGHLRRRARRQLAGTSAAATFDTTAFVHDAAMDALRYLRDRGQWEGVHSTDFLRLATFAMCRDILDRIASENSRKERERRYARGRADAGEEVWEATEALLGGLATLEQTDREAAAILTLSYFGAGRQCTAEAVGALLGLSVRTLERRKREAKEWLGDWMRRDHPDLVD